jgi:16S rRNA (cytosine967-C5)-methyltransferase
MTNYYTDPRRVALEVNLTLSKGAQRPEEALPAADKLLSDRDRRLAHGLVYEGLRHRLRLERLVKAKIPNGRPPKKALEVLKIGLTQLMFMDRVPSFAAVNETVNLAKAVDPYMAGLVNAVMVKLAKEREAKAADPEKLFPAEPCQRDLSPIDKLSIFYSFPVWLTEKAVNLLGFREARAFLAASNLHPRPTLRVNPLKTTREALAASFAQPLAPTSFSPWGLIPDAPKGGPTGPMGPVEVWPGYQAGLFAIQDEASQILPLLAGSPTNILDACAGLGGKTLALAAAFPDASIVSVDTSAKRLAALAAESRRLSPPNPPRILRQDLRALKLHQPDLPKPFDLAVVDAPCTSLGIIRRRPDIKWNVKPQDVAQKATLQLELLLSAADLLAPGGRLLYCVCTFTPEEGPDNFANFLARRPDFSPLAPENFPPNLRPLFVGPGLIRLWPHKHGTDAFFHGLAQKNPS